jgi:hypothetical protein
MGGGGMGGGGGTGGGTGGTGTGTSNHSYSSGSGAAAVGIAVGAAGAVGIALLVRHHHKAKSPEALLIGCTQSQPNGISLKTEGTGETYTLVSTSKHVEPGKRVELKGVVKNDRSGGYAFHVRDVVTDFGACSQSQVASTQSPNGKELTSRAEY